jgi:hypothetical protein
MTDGSEQPGPPGAPPARRKRGRVVAFLVVVLCGVGLSVGYAVHAAGRGAAQAGSGESVNRTGVGVSPGTPVVVFRNTERGPNYGQVSVARLNDPTGPRTATPLQCDRVDMVATVGLCLAASPGIYTSYKAFTFAPDMRITHGFAVVGIPSRARLSPDGRLAAVTTFVTGHSYATSGFSTATMLYDVAGGRDLGNLESFEVSQEGRRIHPSDVNFWGVTFSADGDRFYATMATGGNTFLVEGSIRARAVHTVHGGVECPSLSPDGTHIAFKKRSPPGQPVTWRITVLDLATLQETPLAETRSVDDQIAWYDKGTVAYGLPRTGADAVIDDVWRVPADGGGRPEQLVPAAWSPAFIR